VFGTLTVSTVTNGETQIRMIGDITAGAPFLTGAAAPCYKKVIWGHGVPLLSDADEREHRPGQTAGSYAFNNNVVAVSLRRRIPAERACTTTTPRARTTSPARTRS
jgi:hypothetical protein